MVYKWVKRVFNKAHKIAKPARRQARPALDLVHLEDRITPAAISVPINSGIVVITLGATEDITNLNGSVSIDGRLVTINTVGSNSNTVDALAGFLLGVTVTANQILVNTFLGGLTNFSGIRLIEGGTGPNTITVGPLGIDFSNLGTGSSGDTNIDLNLGETGAADILVINGPIKSAFSGRVRLTAPTINIGATGDITGGFDVDLTSFLDDLPRMINTAGDITASLSGADITIVSPITLTGNVSFTAGGEIDLQAVTGAGKNLTLQTAEGKVTGTKISGVGTLTITNSLGTTFTDTVDAASVVLTDTTGTVQFNGNLTLSTGLTTKVQPYNVNIIGANSTIAGFTIFNNTGFVTFGNFSGDTTTFTGGVNATVPSQVLIEGTVKATTGTSNIVLGDSDSPVIVATNATVGGTATGLISLGDVTLANGATLTVGTGIGNAIALDAITGTSLGSASNLTINTTGLVSVGETVSADIGTIKVTQSGGTTFFDTVTAASVELTDTTGTVQFNGNLTLSTGLTTAAQPYNVNIIGASSTIAGITIFNNTGFVTFGDNSGDTTTFTGGVLAALPSKVLIEGTVKATTGTINIDSNVIVATDATVGGTSTGFISLGDVTLANGATLTVGTGIGNAIFLDAITGTSLGSASNLTINTTGFVSVAETVGTDIGAIKVTQSGGTTFIGTVTAASVELTDTTGTVQFNSSLTLSTGLTTTAQSYNVNIIGANSTIAGITTFKNTGFVTFGDESGDTTTFTGGVTAALPSQVLIEGTVKATTGTSTITLGDIDSNVIVATDATVGGTSTGLISLGDVTLANSATLTVGTGRGNAIDLDAITGTSSGSASNLTINTTGPVSVAEIVGTDIGTITVTQSGGTTFIGTVTAASVELTDTTGTVQFNNNLTLSTELKTTAQPYSVKIFGSSNSIAGITKFKNTSGVVIGDNSADTVSFVSSAVVESGVTLSGIGKINGSVVVSPSGAVAPGNSPGILTFNNDLTLNLGSTFKAEINGRTPGSEYDQLVVTGAVNLSNATLSTSSGVNLAPVFVTGITLISNQGTDPVLGTFIGLPENSLVSVGGARFFITYSGGDGNDVVLERQMSFAASGLATVGGITSSIITIFLQGNPNPFVVTPFPFFVGDLHLAIGDLTQDGTDDLIVGAGPGGGPIVTVFDGRTATSIAAFFPYNIGFTGGVFVATGDLDGNGIIELITGVGKGGGPHVGVFSFNPNIQDINKFRDQGSFFAYDQAYRGGAVVASGDFNNDGRDEVITGTGVGGGPNVRIFSGPTFGFSMLQSFFAYSSLFTGGVYVAAGDLDGDGDDELITGTGQGGGPHVTIFNGSTLQPQSSFFAYDPTFLGGIRVSSADINGDGTADVITGAGVGGGPHLKVLTAAGALIDQFFSGDNTFRGGIFVAGARR